METPLASQSADAVFANEEKIVSFIAASYPTLDLSPGTVLRDLVVRIYAHLETRVQEQIDLALISSSLLEISKNPNLVDAVQVERLLSNFNVTRSAGSTATGKIRLFLSSAASIAITADTIFTAGARTFKAAASYVLVSGANFTGEAAQRVLTPTNSIYTAVVEVVAVATGSAGNIRAGTPVTGVSPTISNFISARADTDFIGGADADDNTALLAKAKDGVTGKVFGGRDHIRAKLKSTFPGVYDVGCVGFLDPEMSRDLSDDVHVGNRVDLYVKSASYPSRLSDRVSAKLLSYNVNTQEALMEMTLPVSTASGLYSVERVYSQVDQQGSYTVVSDMRKMVGNTLHMVGGNLLPAFTSYQTATVTFNVPHFRLTEAVTATGASDLNNWAATAAPPSGLVGDATDFSFFVEYLRMPNLVEIQAYVDSAAERSLSADMLVKAPVPILCSLQMKLIKPAGAADPNLTTLKAALVSKFNSTEMGKPVSASALIHAAYQNIPTGYTIDLPVHMYGVIINPDLTKSVIYSSDSLRPPNQAAKGVSGNTCAFFLESNLIDISIVSCT